MFNGYNSIFDLLIYNNYWPIYQVNIKS